MTSAAAARGLVVVATAVAATLGAMAPASAGAGAGGSPGTVRVIVTYDTLSSARSVAVAVDSVGTVTRTLTHSPHLVATVPAADLPGLRRAPHVRSVQVDVPQKLALDSSVPVIRADVAHSDGYTGVGTTVAILDTGVDVDHPFLGGRVIAQYCSSSPSAPNQQSLCPNGTTEDDSADVDSLPACTSATGGTLCEHGTHVAGIAAGDGTGVAGAPAAGVAPGANIIAMQVFTRFDDRAFCGAASCVASYQSDQLRALDQLAALDTANPSWNIVSANLSLASGSFTAPCDTDPRKKAIDTLLAQGIATVVAAGNSGAAAAVANPGCISSAVTVGATDDADAIAWFSNRGALLDVFAPGVGITSSVPDDAFATFNGTSMAAPHVTGALALLRQHAPNRPITSLVSDLQSSGVPVRYTSGGAGVSTRRIDVMNAIELSTGPRLALTSRSTSVPEGSPMTLAGTWTEGAAGPPVSATASIGTVTLGPGTWSWTATLGDDATLPVTITAPDAGGASRPLTVTARWSNVAPTATLSHTGTRSWNGTAMTFAQAGTPTDFALAVTDPGSDDITTRWTFGDGAREVSSSLLHPPSVDPAVSPSTERRFLTSRTSHTYTRACTRTLAVRATDDDGGSSPTRSRPVVVIGTSTNRHASHWWTVAYRGKTASVGAADRPCLLSTARTLSTVFPEQRPLATSADAVAVLQPAKRTTARSTFDAQLLTVWLDVATGAVDPFAPFDADGNGSSETTVAAFLQSAERTRRTSSATSSALPRLTRVLVRISTTG